jgi:hypothetical protein
MLTRGARGGHTSATFIAAQRLCTRTLTASETSPPSRKVATTMPVRCCGYWSPERAAWVWVWVRRRRRATQATGKVGGRTVWSGAAAVVTPWYLSLLHRAIGASVEGSALRCAPANALRTPHSILSRCAPIVTVRRSESRRRVRVRD